MACYQQGAIQPWARSQFRAMMKSAKKAEAKVRGLKSGAKSSTKLLETTGKAGNPKKVGGTESPKNIKNGKQTTEGSKGNKIGPLEKEISFGRLRQMVKKGQVSKTFERVDKGKEELYEQDHVHLRGRGALNRDGTWKHGGGRLTNDEKQILSRVKDWRLPDE